ncbi:MAG: HPr family phosphocarrier protein [Flavobacteriaceae bacterium]|jgi:phosphocarrier protein|uniref:HPr domain-containing protein n=1 Tax=Flagellimonas olearia TaxID=552546 RepID=A0A444VMB5_9FLAO|nr:MULTISPECIES: HPr family phosphocarrier protein [Allomuricauda]MCR9264092.1 HPr family phosphocarrier protein [Flavobacteriaceae bacterium]RYC51879.1 hypothetical protein DN53_08295 [Allomuricauda olearia]
MISKEYIITDPDGIHARPAANLIKIGRKFQSTIQIKKDKDPIELNSMIGLMTLGAKGGDSIMLTIEGEDELEAAQAIEDFFQNELSKP